MSETLNYIQLLQQPELISKTDVQLFHNWVNESPFVPVYRVLLAAKYQSIHHSDTAQYIEQAAFYVQDRKQLKSLLRQWNELQIEDILEKEEAVIAPNEEVISEVENNTILVEDNETETTTIVEAIEIEEITPHVIEEEIIIEEVSQLIEEEEILETEETEIVIIESESIVDTTEENIISEEDEQITEEDDIKFLKSIRKYEIPIIELNENYDWILEAPENIIPVISENDTIDAGFVNTDISYLMPWINEFEFSFISKEKKNDAPKEIENPPIEIKKAPVEVKEKIEKSEIAPTKETITEEKTDSSTKNHSFDEWLSILEQKKNSKEDAPVFDLPSPAVFTENELSQAKENTIISDHSTLKEKDTKEESAEVKQLAAESVSYKNDMGTETLAKLYVLQGKSELAISIYQKLMVKFPEKNSYFASQIKKLKK